MYKRKKREKRIKIIVASLLILFLIVGFVVNVLFKEHKQTIFEQAIKDSVVSITNILSYPIDTLINKFNKCDRNTELNYESLNNELLKQIEELKKLNQIDATLNEYKITNAVVINRDLNYFYDRITVNKGSSSGVVLNSPVVIGNNLIGKVVNVTNYTSTIRLLTATDVVDKISVKVNNNGNYVYGILSNYKDKKHIIEGISSTEKIVTDSIVTTTGMGDIYPAGIVIGKISGVSTDEFDLANVLETSSFVDFDNINYVSILRRNV